MHLKAAMLLSACAAWSACSFLDEAKVVTRQAAVAQRELFRTVGASADLRIRGEDTDGPYTVVVTYDELPRGISREGLERSVNMIVRKHVHRVEAVEVVLKR